MKLFTRTPTPLVALSVLLVATVSLSPLFAQAEDIYELVIRKQEKKQETRWSLDQYLSSNPKSTRNSSQSSTR
jgi:hypothetical protein